MTLTQPTQIPPAANVPKSETPEIPAVPLFAENPVGQDSRDGLRGGANLYVGCIYFYSKSSILGIFFNV